MKMKYYLRGLATGIVIAAILMALTADSKKPISDEEVRIRAERLGMIMPGSTLGNQENQESATGKPADDATPQAENTMKPESTGEPANEILQTTEPTVAPTKMPTVTETPVVEQEPTMVPTEAPKATEEPTAAPTPTATPKPTPKPTASPKPTATPKPTVAPTATPAPTEAPTPVPTTKPGEEEPKVMVTITIKPGNGSNVVAKLAQDAGLVADAKDFDSYLCRNGYDKSICVGTFEIPMGSTYEEIAKIITKRR